MLILYKYVLFSCKQQEVSKMANKNSLSSILGIAAATVIAAGGSAYVTDTGLQMLDKQSAITQESNLATVERETEMPVTVEKFTATKDSFTVKPVVETESKKDSGKKDTGKNNQTTDGKEKAEGTTEGGSSSDANDSGITVEGGSKSDNNNNSSKSGTQPVSYDEWGGWMAANGDYYDGQGGYWDGNGYHYVGDSIKTPDGAANYKPSSDSSGSSSESNSSSSSGGWDDSYILYDTAVRYMSGDELSDWGPWELAAARNEIFARHGRIFVTPEWSSYFATKSWYTPLYSDVDDMLSDCEWSNLKMIMKLEEKYY